MAGADGLGRAGWYSWDHLDNWGHPSDTASTRVATITVGDHLPAMPDGSLGWEVAALEPEHFLGLRASVDLRGRPFDPAGRGPRYYTDSLWAFLLEEQPGNQTGWWSAATGHSSRVGCSRS